MEALIRFCVCPNACIARPPRIATHVPLAVFGSIRFHCFNKCAFYYASLRCFLSTNDCIELYSLFVASHAKFSGIVGRGRQGTPSSLFDMPSVNVIALVLPQMPTGFKLKITYFSSHNPISFVTLDGHHHLDRGTTVRLTRKHLDHNAAQSNRYDPFVRIIRAIA